MNRRAALTGLAATLALPGLACAQASAGAVARANAGTIGIIAGGLDGTYTRFAADIADFENFQSLLWHFRTVKLQTVRP